MYSKLSETARSKRLLECHKVDSVSRSSPCPYQTSSSGNTLVTAGSYSDGGKNPLTWKEFSAVERISDPCRMKLIRSALNSGCAGSHWVGFWQLALLSDCNVICLQWQTGTGRRADCGLPGSWEVAWCSRRDHTWLRTPTCVMMNGRWVRAQSTSLVFSMFFWPRSDKEKNPNRPLERWRM